MRTRVTSEWVICRASGSPLRDIRKSWQTACGKAGLVDARGQPLFTPHDLRHTFASRHVMNGTPTFTVSQLLNHRDLSTVRRDAHLREAYRRETSVKNSSHCRRVEVALE